MTIADIRTPDPDPQGEEVSRWRAWRRRFERKQPEPEYFGVTGTEVVKWEASDEVEPTGWAWVEKHAINLPNKREVRAKLKHAAPRLPGILAKHTFVTIPKGVWAEGIQPTWRGAGKCATAYHRWVTAVHLDEAQKVAEGPLKARTLVTRHGSHGYRIWASIIAALAAAGGMAYLYYVHLGYFFVVLISLVCILDLIGRAGHEKQEEAAPVYREPLREGMPYKQLTASIQAAFNEIIGVDANGHPLVRVDGICSYDFDREEWRQNLSTFQEIKEEHVRTLERSIGGALRSVRILEVPEVATRRILSIKNGDPFVDVPAAPWLPTNSQNIADGLLLGKSQTPMPYRVHFAGVHVGVVGGSGSGKSEGTISAIIEGILACYNAVPVGIDLTEGPIFPIYGDCIQRVAYTPEDADALLDWLLAEIKERAKILGDIARSSDPNDKGREWNVHLAAKYNKPSVHLIVDESPQAVKFNGQPKGSINLAAKLEVIARTGSKHWVTLVLASQKTGKSDAGSTGISSQIMTWLVGPCTQDDANEIFSPELRRAGWAPNLLKPAVRNISKNDAGRVYVSAAGFGPDICISWTPMPEPEIKRRRDVRLADGLPRITSGVGFPGDSNTMEGKIVPNTLSALAAALDEIEPVDGKLPSAMAAEWISTHSNEEIDAMELAKRLRAETGDMVKPQKGRTKLRPRAVVAYYLADDVNKAMEAL